MCLIRNNIDLFSFRSPILNAGTSLPRVQCHVWILASDDSLKSDYRASQMTTTNEALLRIYRKSKGSFVFWSCYVDHLKFDNVHIHQPTFQPYILLGCLGHNHCLLGMWSFFSQGYGTPAFYTQSPAGGSENTRSVHPLRNFPVAYTLKNLLALHHTWVRSLGWEDPLEKWMATHSSILAWKLPWTEEPGRLQFMRSQSRTRLSR